MAALVVNVPLPILAAGTYGELTYNVNVDVTVEIVDCNRSATSVDIPAEIDGMSVTSIGNYAFSICYRLVSINIPDSVTSIGDYAFYSCDGLTSISLPDSVTSIGDRAFYYCESLYAINVDVKNKNYSSVDGILFNKSQTELITCPSGMNGKYTIPNSVTSIGNGAFSSCNSLTSINIPDSVASIGNDAFNRCNGLTSINIPDSVTSIGDSTFYSCDSLTSINIPSSVASIGDWAFYDCYNLTDVYYGGTEEQWDDIIIGSDNSYLTNANIHFNSRPSTPSTSTAFIKSVKMTRNGTAYNLLTTKQTFEKGSSETASFVMEVDWVDSNGNTLESKKIHLQITEPVTSGELGGDHTFKLFDAISFTVPDDKPVLNNQTFNFDFGMVDADIEHDGDTFKATIGVNFKKR